MYEEYFGLKRKPFSIVPDPACFYISEGHREALAHLMYGTIGDGGFVLLTGEVGTGKTTACRRFFELAPETTDVAFILNPKLTPEELLATICDEFGVGCPEGTSIRVLVGRINAYLLNAHDRGHRAVLIIEEAQNLALDVLEQIRLLTNLETNQRKLLQVVMIGQPELRDILAKPQLSQLSQRITARYHLGPLSREEVTEYINFRLSAAGAARGRLFPPATVKEVYGLTKGIPRLINVVCDRALLGAFVQEKDSVDVRTLRKAAREVMAEEHVKGRKARIILAAGFLLLLCAAFGALSYMAGSRQWAFGIRAQTDRPIVRMKAAPASAQPAGAPGRPDAQATLIRPARSSGPATRDKAYLALCRQWHVPYNGHDSRPLCDQADGAGVKCLVGRGGIANLLDMNRPAVLRLTDDAPDDYYALLTAVNGETATFSLGDEKRTVDIRELAQWWSGDYLVLWRVPPEYEGELRRGSRGRAVAWLQKQLALVQGRTVPTGERPVYDEAVARQVKEFQISAGIRSDGIAGPKTILRLWSASPDNRDPVLRAVRSEKRVD